MSTRATMPLLSAAVHDAGHMRSAGRDWLSLALMDARTRTLGWLSVFDGLALSGGLERLDPPLWLIGHVAWYQEYWIGRHLQRRQGAAADPGSARLPSLEPSADRWFSPTASRRAQRWEARGLPEGEVLRRYLQATLEGTLELLEKTEDEAVALHVFRQALHHEDLAAETLAVLAQALDLSPERQSAAQAQGLTRPWRTLVRRDPIGLHGQRVSLGHGEGGWAPEPERGDVTLAVADFEIDAQPVSWAQYAEFVDDGAYDERRWWTEAGWDWLEAVVRRAPRYVEQVSGGVLARRQGRLQRMPAGQAVLHVSAHEADAWCRWAGRRLPSEAEWALAARQAGARGFAWGEALEWVAGSARALPGGVPPGQGLTRLLRGGTSQASARLVHPDARRYAAPDADEAFCSFRSCAL